MATRYPKDNALVAFDRLDSREREDLKVGDEVIVAVNYGSHRLRETITKRTEKQVTLSNDSRYTIRTGRKIGSSESYTPPSILGRPRYPRDEAERLNAAIVAAAKEAAHAAAIADILDRVEELADEQGLGIGEVLGELNDLNITRLGEAIRANEAAKAGE